MRKRELSNRGEEKRGGPSPYASLMRHLDKRATRESPRRGDRDSKSMDDDKNVVNLDIVRNDFIAMTANTASVTVFNAEEMINKAKLGWCNQCERPGPIGSLGMASKDKCTGMFKPIYGFNTNGMVVQIDGLLFVPLTGKWITSYDYSNTDGMRKNNEFNAEQD